MTDVLPRWDLTPFFPSLADPALVAAVAEVGAETARLVVLYDAHDVRGGPPRAVDAAAIAAPRRVPGPH